MPVALATRDMRRTAARNLRRAGVAEGVIIVIMRIGGWRTRSVFERYNIVSQAEIQDALQRLERQNSEGGKQDATMEFGHNYGHDGHDLDAVDVQNRNGKVN
jgi:hypothetical protein